MNKIVTLQLLALFDNKIIIENEVLNGLYGGYFYRDIKYKYAFSIICPKEVSFNDICYHISKLHGYDYIPSSNFRTIRVYEQANKT